MNELRELGYEYRGEPGRLLQVGKDEGFKFVDQEHYEKLADAVLAYVETLLVSQGSLERVMLPLGSQTGPQCPIYVSPGFDAADKVLLLIQGSGRVRVGVWGCALCINKDLDQGTMVPYVRRAAEQGYGVIVLNPNMNSVEEQPISGSEDPPKHVAYVWENLVLGRCKEGAAIDIVAHSNGGKALLAFLQDHADQASRMRRVVFTDSYHKKEQVDALSGPARELLDRTVNYVPHEAPFGTAVDEWKSLDNTFTKERTGCACLSAAVADHAATNHASLSAAFEYFAAAQ